MKRFNAKRRKNGIVTLFIVGTILFFCGFMFWVLYLVFPSHFPPGFATFFQILAGLGILINVFGALFSNILLPFWDRVRNREKPQIVRLLESHPIRNVDYDSLISRLGRSGRIPWINRDVVTAGLLRRHGQVAIVGWMKSGKTREAAELIRMSLENGWISQVYEPTSALDLIDEESLPGIIAADVDERQRCLLFVDELGLRPEPERLNKISKCIESIRQVRPDTYFLITIQHERLSTNVQQWLDEHRFHQITLPSLKLEQSRVLVSRAKEILKVNLTPDGAETLASHTDGRPYSIIFTIQQASNSELLTAENIYKLIARSDEEAWAEQRRHIIAAEPAASFLLESIVTFISAGITPRETSIERYAEYIINNNPIPTGNKRLLLKKAAERWAFFDIVASGGLYTIPEPLLLPILINVDEARIRLLKFVECYNPRGGILFAFKLADILDFFLKPKSPKRFKFRFLLKLRSKKLVWAFRIHRMATRIFRFLLPLSFRTKIKNVKRNKKTAWGIKSRLIKWVTGKLLSWRADQALLVKELGGKLKKNEYISSNILVERARYAYDHRNYANALDYLERALLLNPQNIKALLLRAKTYKSSGDYEKAIADYDRAIALNPEDDVAYHNRGCAYDDSGDYEKAIADCDRAIALNPEYAEAYESRGLAYKSSGDYEKAIADYDRAIALNPENALTYIFRGSAYSGSGDYEKAIADYDRAIALNPEYAVAYNNRGLAYDHSGDYEKAIADYDRAIALNPEDAVAYNNRGLAYNHSGDYEKAIADYDRAIALNPEDDVAYHNRGCAYDDSGDYEKAIADYDRAIALNPEVALTYRFRGDAYGDSGDYEKAIADYDRAIALNPEVARFYYNKALALALVNQTENSCKCLKKAIDIDKEYRNIAREDKDFDKIRTSVCFQEIIGVDQHSD